MKRSLLILAGVAGFLTFSCTKTDTTNNASLKQSVTSGVTAINTAIGTISKSKGFEILSSNMIALKSTEVYTDSITLSSVAGIYEFKPDPFHFFNFFIPHRLFVKTGTSSEMIVKLPQKLVFHSRYLHEMNAHDSILKNDFTIKASDYYYYLNFYNKFDYRLAAGLTLDTTKLGNMNISASADKQTGQSYTSKYTFPGGYSVAVSAQSNDSTVSSFSLTKDNTILLKETVITTKRLYKDGGEETKDEFHHRERLYILTVGNVDIKRGSGLDSIQVYLNGVLQKHAGAKIIDSAGTDGSICHKRDILLIFDDGTTTNLSTLINPAREALKTLVDALHSMNFAKNIVDYIAIGIDYHFHHNHN